MSAPNPELVEALNNANYRENHREIVEHQIKEVAEVIKEDLGRSHYAHQTVAALITYAPTVRFSFMSRDDLARFDEIVERTRQRINTMMTQAPPGATVVSVLQKNRDTRIVL